ncbi:MAG TPA: hypothetical protein VNC40_12445 [Gaiellaceae bacterium]|nr:hypothetical protein [Gaiellaceae bacterium]
MRHRLAWSEAGAFGFLLLTVVAFAAVAVAGLAGGSADALWVGALLSSVVIVVAITRHRPGRALRTAPAHLGEAGEHQILVLAQETPSEESLNEVGSRADRVVVVSAASPPFLRRWTSDIDDARARAGSRVDETVRRLRAANVDATGAIGDDDPVRAVEDALREFGGDEIVVATGGSSQDAGVAARVRARFALPVTHVTR